MVSRTRDLILRFRRGLAVAIQLTLVVAANSLAFVLRFDGDVPEWARIAFWQMLPWLVAIRAFTFFPFRLYEGLWRYTSLYDLKVLVGAVSASTAVFYAVASSPVGPPVYPRSIFIIDACLLVLMLGGVRLTRRLYSEFALIQPGARVLIFGAGDAAERIVRDMKTNREFRYNPIGFIDDDVGKLGRRIHGVPVLGTRHDVPRIVQQHRPDEVLIAIPSAESSAVRSIVRVFEPFKIPIKTLPNVTEITGRRLDVGLIRNLSLEDLLTRPPVGLDRAPLRHLIAGRRVMVTGAGGSIGSELCRQIARLKPSTLLMFDRYENSLHAVWMELQDQQPSFDLVPVVGDVTDEVRVGELLHEHRPEIIFHAAAHKHVPLMEENPCEAVKNNVRGTRIMVQAAELNGVDRFIMISTDKAVNPTSVMGASKQLAELVVHAQADDSRTSFSIVRFGNVLGSNGSVVPRFMDQIRKGGPVTVTHPEMRRFFMLIPEAVQLVLHAASRAESGGIYALEMGQQVKLVDMARDMIRLSGFVPDIDIKIKFVGLRPGEKLFEELVGSDEAVEPSSVDSVLCVRRRRQPASNFLERIEALEEAAAVGLSDAVLAAMKEITGLDRAVPQKEDQGGIAAAVQGANVLQHRPSQPARKVRFANAPRRGRIR
jgi:FlaA1/EpsC-like NDP-sugar epimerase